MSCAEILRTQAFIDGEVGGEAAVAAERHIAGCADCQAFCAEVATLSDAIRDSVPRYAAPSDLRRRLDRALDAEDAARRAAARAPARRSFWRGAFSGAGAAGLAAGLAVVALQPPSPVGLADQVTNAHTRALMNDRVIQVASSDHHTVKPWFAGRIAISPPVKDFPAEGFKLAGGRLDRVAGAPAAVLVYQHGRHKVDLVVWADRGGGLPGTTVRHGYRSTFWKAGDLDFAAVSDTAAPELENFVQLVRSEPE
jgi:anti-sigma factor RsiW